MNDNDRLERYNEVLEYWKNRGPFTDEDDIPSIPIVKDDDYRRIIIPNIIRCCRNASEAVWDGEKFTYLRTKFGTTYTEFINHFEDDDGYDVFVPIRIKDTFK